MDDSTVMAVLKSSRKARKQTTCYPCQRRKVKCDRGLPCSVCVSRGHSFLCSYGRPAETSRTIPTSSALTREYDSGSQSQNTESQMFALREQLNHVQEELQHARKRHRQFEEAEDQVRRLQARCREYEDIHTKLRSGDWSALERINESHRDDSDTSSIGPDSSGRSQGAGSGDGKEFGVLVEASQTDDITAITASTVQCSKSNTVSTAHSNKSQLPAITPCEAQQMVPTVCSIPSVQKPQDIFDQGGFMPGPKITCYPSARIDETFSFHYEGSFKSTLHSSVSNRSSYEYMVQQMRRSELQQNQTTSPSGRLKDRQNAANHHSTTPGFPTGESNQQQAGVQVLRSPNFIDNTRMAASNPISERTDVSSNISWTQFSLFPPMIFGQDQELMERSYADYCAKIVVEAQRSTLLAG